MAGRSEVERAAAEERRSLASVIRHALLEWASQRISARAKAA